MFDKARFYTVVFSISFLSVSSLVNGQKLDSFFDHPPQSYTLCNMRAYYDDHYSNLTLADSAAKQNSNLLQTKNEFVYLMNELTRAQLLAISGKNKEAIALLYVLKKNPALKRSPKLYGYYYNVYGIIEFNRKKYESARLNYLTALSLLTKATDSVGIKGNLINIANTFSAAGDYESAKGYYLRAVELEKSGCMEYADALKINLANNYMHTNELEKAINLQQQLISTFREKGNYHGEIVVSFNQVQAFMNQQKYDQAIQLLYTIQRLCEQHQMKRYMQSVYHTLSDCFEAQGNYKQAQQYLHYSYQISNAEKEEELGEYIEKLKAQHQTELFKKEQKIKDEQINQEKLRQLGLIILLGFVLVFLIFVVFFNRKIDRKNKLLVAKNIELTERFTSDRKKKSEFKVILPELIEQFEHLLDQEKIFMNPELSLDKLSKLLNTNRSYLSETINLHYNESFRTIINCYRINEARSLLVDPNFHHYSIEGIALSVGYRSISSFNSVFKKETGITPSYFRNHSFRELKKKNELNTLPN